MPFKSFLRQIGNRQNSKPELLTIRFTTATHSNGTNLGIAEEGANFGTVTQNGTGDYTITFNRAGRRAYRLVGGNCTSANAFIRSSTESTTAIRFITVLDTGILSNQDCNLQIMGFFGSLQR